MTKLGECLIAAAETALAHSRGEDAGVTEEIFVVPDKVDVKAIRKAVDMTQLEFASYYGFGIASVRSWEQGVRTPNQSTRLFLKVIEKRPNIIQEIFASEPVKTMPGKTKATPIDSLR